MALLSITKAYVDSPSSSLTKAQLDNFKTDLEAYFNTSKGLRTAQFQENTIDARVKVKAASIATADISNTEIVEGKCLHAPQVLSSNPTGTGTAQISNGSTINDANAATVSTTITTLGRPVLVMFQPDGSGTASTFRPANEAAGAGQDFVIKRDTTEIARFNIGSERTQGFFPGSMVNVVDVVSAGTYAYTVEGGVAGDNNDQFGLFNLLAVELW